MILVRDVFQLKFAKAREAKSLLKDAVQIKSIAKNDSRVMTDLIDNSYTLVLETTYENLTDYEEQLNVVYSDSDWKSWYSKFKQLAESGYREVFTIVE
jgi:hypothetical protein